MVWWLGFVAWMGASIATALTVGRALGQVGKRDLVAIEIRPEEANRQRAG